MSKPRPTYTLLDVQKLVKAAEGDLMMSTLIQFMVGSGTRLGEALALKWGDINLLEGDTTLKSRATRYGVQKGLKAHKEGTRYVALPKWALDALEALYTASETDDDAFMFRNHAGDAMTHDIAERRFRKLRQEVGLDGMHLHDLRHISVTSFIEQGASEKAALARAGHSGYEIGQRYWHSGEEEQRTLARAMPDPMKAKTMKPSA